MQVVTVNCARIIHGNQVATNGVVHVIDRIISAAGNTIQDVLEVDDDLSSLSVSTLTVTFARVAGRERGEFFFFFKSSAVNPTQFMASVNICVLTTFKDDC